MVRSGENVTWKMVKMGKDEKKTQEKSRRIL